MCRQTDLEEERIKRKMANRTRAEKCRIYALRAALNLAVMAVLVACFYCIYIATVFSQRKQAEVMCASGVCVCVTFLIRFPLTAVCLGGEECLPVGAGGGVSALHRHHTGQLHHAAHLQPHHHLRGLFARL